MKYIEVHVCMHRGRRNRRKNNQLIFFHKDSSTMNCKRYKTIQPISKHKHILETGATIQSTLSIGAPSQEYRRK